VSRLAANRKTLNDALRAYGRRRRPDKRGKMRRSPSFRPFSAHLGSRQARSPTVSFLHCGAVHRFQDLAQIVVFRFPAQKSGFWPIPANPAESGGGSQCVVLSGPMSSRQGPPVFGWPDLLAVHRFQNASAPQCIVFALIFRFPTAPLNHGSTTLNGTLRPCFVAEIALCADCSNPENGKGASGFRRRWTDS